MSTLAVGPDQTGRSVVIVDGRIAAAAAEANAGADVTHLPCPHDVIAPGAVNAHTHLYSGLAPLGLPAAEPPPENFPQILERVWWRLDRALDAETLAAAAEYYVAHALLHGTTGLVDHHESPNLIEGSLAILATACAGLGIRALLCYGASERNFGRSEAERGLGECAALPASALLRPLVGLHASFTVSDETILQAGDLARAIGGALHIHVAEDRVDVDDAQARGYDGPLERLEALGALGDGAILAHGVHLSDRAIRRAGKAGCWLVHNPRSNEGNRVGYAAGLAKSDRVALGTDGWEADMAVETAALRRLAAENGQAFPAERPAKGARLIAHHFGAVEDPFGPGGLGDLVVRDAQGSVRHVVVDGQVVVRDGRLTRASLDEIEARARHAAGRLWTRMAAL